MQWAERMFFQNDRRSTLFTLLALYAVVLIFSYLTFVASEKSYVAIWLNDVVGFLDIANRVHKGQMPYEDFHLFYGPAVAVVPALGLDLGFNAGVVFGFDAVVVAGFLLLTTVAALPQRLTLPAASLVFVFVSLLIVVPMTDGGNFFGITWANFYNRQSWAALLILFLFFIEPQSLRSTDKWLDGVAVAALVLFTIYTKITFGVVALGFLIANSATSKYNRDISMLGMAFIIFVVASLEAVFHFHLAYWHNIIEFMSRTNATGGGIWVGGIVSMLIENSPIVLSCLAALLAARVAGRRSTYDSLFVAGGVIASFLVRYSTGVGGGLAALVAVLVALGELTRRAEKTIYSPASARFDRKSHLTSMICLFLATLFSLPEVGNRLVAWEDFYVKVKDADLSPIAGNPPTFASIIVPNGDSTDLYDLHSDSPNFIDELMRFRTVKGPNYELSARDYMRTIVEGVGLLKSVDYRNRSVFTFDMVNPFTVALDMRPTRNGFPQFWIGGPYSGDANILPRSEELFADADFVMVPRLPITSLQFLIMKRIYGPFLGQNYFQMKESPHWELWAHKEAL